MKPNIGITLHRVVECKVRHERFMSGSRYCLSLLATDSNGIVHEIVLFAEEGSLFEREIMEKHRPKRRPRDE